MTKKLLHLVANDRNQLNTLGKPASSVLRVHQTLQQKPIISIAKVAEERGLTIPTVIAAFKQLMELKRVREVTGRKRRRLYIYIKYIHIINEGIS